MTSRQVIWDFGTAYDLFVSLEVLHKPGEFGVRGSWAAGVRARLPSTEREMLEQGWKLVHVPFHWLHSLPQPKDGSAVLWSLGQIPPAERLPALTLSPTYPAAEVAEVLRGVAARGTWDADDQEAVRTSYCCEHKEKSLTPDELESILGWWTRAEEFGERYLQALRTYHDVFFAEEERHIAPALHTATARAQDLAERLPLADLLEELSQGIRFDELPGSTDLVLAPSYWCTPLIFYGSASADVMIILYGARPADESLVPGELVPDALLRALKALSVPTRLRIMHYLAQEALTPAQLSRRLRLRAPTVTHHLKTLRLAGLVQMTLGEGKEPGQYAVRTEAVAATCESLQSFLAKHEPQE